MIRPRRTLDDEKGGVFVAGIHRAGAEEIPEAPQVLSDAMWRNVGIPVLQYPDLHPLLAEVSEGALRRRHGFSPFAAATMAEMAL